MKIYLGSPCYEVLGPFVSIARSQAGLATSGSLIKFRSQVRPELTREKSGSEGPVQPL